MSTETVSAGEPVTPVTGTSTETPVALLSGIAAFAGVAENTFAVVLPPPPLVDATDFAISSLTFATLTYGFEGLKRPVGDHRKSMWRSSESLQTRPPMTLPVEPTSRM